MTVLMTKKKADKLATAEKNKYLFSDQTVRDTALDGEPPRAAERWRKEPVARTFLELRMKTGM